MYDLIVIGGGAAGFFAAINAQKRGLRVALLEKSRQPLAKVRISGGGRCNVTHACFDPSKLVSYYPRGSKELRGPFSRFQPQDTIHWFQERGVELKTEADGRMFPITDSSQTIIDCLQQERAKTGVELILEADVVQVEPGFTVQLANGRVLEAKNLLLATGSNRKVFGLLEGLGHTIIPCVPSLFTFNIKDFDLVDIAGVSVQNASIEVLGITQKGPLLITHWGFSGPSVLRASAWGARLLHDAGYKAQVTIDWLAGTQKEALLIQAKQEHAKKQLSTYCPYELPQRLWKALLAKSGITVEERYAELSKAKMQKLLGHLSTDRYQIEGQTTNKEEFVTCGGVSLTEVNFKTMQSKIVPGLYFAGEILDIDGVTGGFNFQNAWTTAWIASHSIEKH